MGYSLNTEDHSVCGVIHSWIVNVSEGIYRTAIVDQHGSPLNPGF